MTAPATSLPGRRLVIVVRADPVICGHSGEARNLAEAALHRGFDDVRIVTWPIDRLVETGLPLKPLDGVLPYSPGITVERPAPVGDYKVPDGRFLAGLTGRLVELFTDGVPTVALSLYLSPHAIAVADAVRVARATGLPVDVTTVAEAVGSDVTNVVRACVEEDRFGAAAHVLSSYLAHDVCLAVSDYTRTADRRRPPRRSTPGTGPSFAARCRDRVAGLLPRDRRRVLRRGGPRRDRARAGRARARARRVRAVPVPAGARQGRRRPHRRLRARARRPAEVRLVIAGNGPQADALRALAAASPEAARITFLDDVDDAEKAHLMAGCAAYVLPSKPRPGVRRDLRHRAGREDAVRRRAGHHDRDRRHRRGGRRLRARSSRSRTRPRSPRRWTGWCWRCRAVERADWERRGREHGRQFDRAAVLDGMLGWVDAVRAGRGAGRGRGCGWCDESAGGQRIGYQRLPNRRVTRLVSTTTSSPRGRRPPGRCAPR